MSHTQPPQFRSCFAALADGRLTVANRLIERTWQLRNGRLYAVSMLDKTAGRQWCKKPSDQPSLWAGQSVQPGDWMLTTTVEQHPVSASSLRCVLSNDGGQSGYIFDVFDDSAAIVLRLLTGGPAAATTNANPAQTVASGIETAPAADATVVMTDVVDALDLDARHVRLTQVTLADQTDNHDNLTAQRSWLLYPGERIEGVGNLFFLEQTLSGDGVILLRLAPLPHARPVRNAVDLIVAGDGQLNLLGHGLDDGGGAGYPAVCIVYQGGRVGRIKALQTFQRQLRPYVAGRDGRFLSNTWGDRSRDGRLCESFMKGEIDAAARLGVDVVQIDDGWQQGTTSNSVNAGGVWSGFWAADDDFWRPHAQRFADGLTSTLNRAKGAGVGVGLWFAPDSADDFANWQRDAHQILKMHRQWGVNTFKIDGVKAHTKAAERNLHRFFEQVLQESGGRVVFDLDVTAEIRPGYFGLPQVGPLFVENRYTDWGSYWPHRTLRNLWMLSHYIDPVRLRMEFLNTARNAARYGDDALAPSKYTADYLFASIMFAAPLGWFEVSNLPDHFLDAAAGLVSLWKRHRDAIHTGHILPIGDEPSGRSWTGFASVSPAGEGFAVVLREQNDQTAWTLPHSQIARSINGATMLRGNGRVSIEGGELKIELPTPLSYAFIQFQSRPPKN